MREIKFRLRDRHNKIVGYEKWYTGSWRTDNPDEEYSLESGWWEAQPCWLYSTDNEHWTPTYISHRYKDQYIGLNDRNGKEIYEGDIVKIKCICGYESAGEVKWFGTRWRLRFKCDHRWDNSQDFFNQYDSDREVIGNIYENPLDINN